MSLLTYCHVVHMPIHYMLLCAVVLHANGGCAGKGMTCYVLIVFSKLISGVSLQGEIYKAFL